MALYPHLHLLIPASDSSIQLEVRLYLPSSPPSSSSSSVTSAPQLPLTTAVSSEAMPVSGLDPALKRALGEWGIARLITAAHPWSRFNGHMLDSMIAQYLVGVTSAHSKRIAVLSFNVRGTGQSTGAQPWPVFNLSPDMEDFVEAERWGTQVLHAEQVLRFGVSWGCFAALNLPPRSPLNLASILIVSPALTLFWVLSLFGTRSFRKELTAALRGSASPEDGSDAPSKAGRKVWMIYGDKDEYTGVGSYRSLAREMVESGLVAKEVEGATHFYRSEENGERCKLAIGEWLDSV